MSNTIKGAIVITGASTGIGRACAIHFANAGYHVFAGVRKHEDGECLIADVGTMQEHRVKITPLMLDVTDGAQIAAAVDVVAAEAGADGVHALINNAGYVVPAPVEIVPIEDLRQQLEINTIGLVAVTQAFLPLLRQTAQSGSQHHPVTIVNMSSVSGLSSFPLTGPYSASKYAVEALTDALRVELRPWKIRVVAIEPGPVATPIWEKVLDSMDVMFEKVPPEKLALYDPLISFMRKITKPNQGIPVAEVVAAVDRAVTAARPRARYTIPFRARLRLLLNFLPTGLRDRLIANQLPTYP